MHAYAEMLFALGVTAAAAFDVRARRVPNRLNLALLLVGLGARAVVGGPSGLADGALGAVLGLGLLLLPFSARWIGGGDVKLVAAMGAWLGPAGVLWATLLGLAGGGLVSLALLARAGGSVRAEVATNLRYSLLALDVPRAPRRRAGLLVPLALPLALAGLAVLWTIGGLQA